MDLAMRFNRSAFSRWLNSTSGRVFRAGAGLAWLTIGIRYRDRRWGIAALAWSVFPLTAGWGDVCYISRALGGPFPGREIRKQQARM